MTPPLPQPRRPALPPHGYFYDKEAVKPLGPLDWPKNHESDGGRK